MQQRRLRLGDIVDDYCPRERRITNHAVVAMIEDEVKQTRCTTCDADHEYKQARIPAPRRRKDSAHPADAVAGAPRKRPAADGGDLDVIDSPDAESSNAAESVMPLDAADTNDVPAPAEETVAPHIAAPEADAAGADAANGDAGDGDPVPLQASQDAASAAGFDAPQSDDAENAEPAPVEDEGPVHRRLIRATLPRPEGQPPERKIPEFTMHQREINGNRAGRSHRRGPRPGQMRAQQGNGQSSRFGGQRQGPRHGSGQGGGQGQAGQPRRRKRRR